MPRLARRLELTASIIMITALALMTTSSPGAVEQGAVSQHVVGLSGIWRFTIDHDDSGVEECEVKSNDALSLSTPHEYTLPHLGPGKNRLTIRVDNKIKVGVGISAQSISDHIQSNWNGLL